MTRVVKTLAVCILASAGIATASAQHAALSSARIQQIAAMLPAAPTGVGVPCSDRAAWTPLAGQFKPEIARAEAILQTPFPAWSDDAYLTYTRTGSRKEGEKMLHDRQGELDPLVLAECAEGRGRFIARIATVLDGLAAQKSWTLPAHDPRLTSYNGTRYFVELNSADLAHTIAETLYLLGDKLPESTRTHAMAALDQRIFAPMRATYVADKGQTWLHNTANWNAVCLKGVTGAALAVLPSREDRALFVAGAEHYIGYYRQGFNNDGYGAEGLGYWNYGFSHYAELREILWQATGSKLDLFSDPKMQKVALFGAQFAMFPGNSADFGDSHYMVQPDANLMAYINRIFGLGLTAAQPSTAHAPGSLTLAVEDAFPNPASELHGDSAQSGASLIGLRTWYPDEGVLVSRPAPGGRLAATIKAGGNTGHSHNDVGSFVIGLGATQPVGDPGGPSYYTAETFSSKRLTSRLINSYGHPVPVIGGQQQLDATEVHATVLKTDFTPEQDTITIDMTPAYRVPTLRRFERTMRYSRKGAGSVEIEDSFDLSAPTDIEESLPTHGTWQQLDPHTLLFTAGSERLRVAIDAPSALTVSQEKIDDYANPFTRVAVRLHLEGSGKVTVRFTPEQ